MPTGIAMAAVLRWGAGVWPGIFLGSLAVNIWLLGQIGLTPLSAGIAAFAAAVGNTVEATLAGYWVERWTGGRDPFLRSRDVVVFIFLAALLCTGLSALCGVTAVSAVRGDWAGFGGAALTWWLGDAAGALLVTPLLLALGRKGRGLGPPGRKLEFLLFAICTAALWSLCYFRVHSLVVLFFPWTALVALRLGPSRSSAIVFLLAALSTGGLLLGASPFSLGALQPSLLLQQGFIACIAVAALVLSSTVWEMEGERSRLRKAYNFERELFERSPMGLSLSTLDGRLVEVNPAFAGLVGRTREEVLSAPVGNLTPHRWWKEGEARNQGLFETGRFGPWERECVRSDGTRVPVRVSGFVVEWHGRPHMWSSVEDISDRVQAEEALRESGERLRSLGDNLPNSYVYHYTHKEDGTPHFIYLSAGVEKLHGVKPSEALRDASLLIGQISPDQRQAFNELEEASRTNLTDFSMEVRMRRGDGTWRWFLLHSRPRLGSRGRVVWDGVATDVTQRKEAEERLDLLNRVLKTLSEVNEMIVREDDTRAVWSRACEILVRHGEMAMAWIGVKDPSSPRLRPVACAGMPLQELEGIVVRWDDTPEGQGAMGTAMRTKRHSVHQDLLSEPRFGPWKGFMAAHGFRSVAAFPLLLRGDVAGALAVYTQRVGDFHPDVVSLLDRLAADLGYAQEAIDDRAEKVRAEEALRVSEAKYRELVENANSIILRWLPDGTITFMNEFGLRFFGYREAELLGRRLVGSIVPEREDEGRDLRPLMDEIGRNPTAFEQNVNENVRKDGTRAWIAWTNKAVLDPEGRVSEVFSVGTDITDKRRSEQEIIALNAALERRVEERTRELSEAVEALHAEKAGLQWAQERIVALNASLEKQARELKVANKHLANALDKAESADRVKSAFLAAMSHELRTPLNSVIGFTGALLGGLVGAISPEQREALEIVQRNGKHLLALINDVLDLSKLEAGQMRLSHEPFDLAKILREAVQALGTQAGAKSLALTLEGAGVPMPSRGDPRRVAQIVLNLISNAIKFTEKGSIGVRLARSDEVGDIDISVSDTGIGILPADLERIFGEFEQLDAGIARGTEGTGLGLTLSRRMARLMGGDILVQSVRGQGSTFTLRLPAGEREP
jgi:PAS domain S-box-containing protein